MSDDRAMQATPSAELERQIMDCRVPKNEREWWAAHEIERLRAALSTPAHPTAAPVERQRDAEDVRVRAIIEGYYAALRAREHGGIAQNQAMRAIELLYGMEYRQ